MFNARDRFFAELVVARGFATQETVRAAAMRPSAVAGPGMLPRLLFEAHVLDEVSLAELEGETDRWRRSCACHEVFFGFGPQPLPCPRCRRPVLPDSGGLPGIPSTRPDGMVPSPFSPLPSPPPPHYGMAPGGPGAPPGSFRASQGHAALRVSGGAPALVAPPTPGSGFLKEEVRSQYGNYRVVEELGRGGMGVVFRAVQEPIGREVALKVLLEPKGKRRERFMREARAAAKIDHPNVVRIHDVGEDEGVAFYTMDFLRGKPLDRLLSETGGLEPMRALAIMEPLARAVACAHDHKILHRDLKPGNVLIVMQNGAEAPVLIDFGLARALDDEENKLTRTGVAIGTPHYMSPEQVRGIRAEINEQTDVWALGVMLWEMLVGERPFRGDSAAQLYAQIQTTDCPLVRTRAPHVPAAIEAIIAKALERPKDRRYKSAHELADEIGRVRRGENVGAMNTGERLARTARRAQPTARKVGLFLVVTLIVAAGGVAYKLYSDKRTADALKLKTAGEVERIRAKASGILQRARSRAQDSARTPEARQARAIADEAVQAIDSLVEQLKSEASTEGSQQAAVAQAQTPDALAAMREVLAARARACLRNPWSGDLGVALADLARARKGVEDDAELAALHAEVLVACDRADEAEAALAAAEKAHPDDRSVLRLLAEARLAQGAVDGALPLLDRILSAQPDDAPARLARARARLRAGKGAAALEDVDHAAKLARDDAKNPVAALILGEAREVAVEIKIALGRLDEAFREAHDLVKQKPDDRSACAALARAATERGDHEGTVRALTRALARRSDDSELLALRGRAYLALLDDDRAAADLRGAAEHAPTARRRALLRIELAELLSVLGRADDATKDLDRALAAAGDDKVARAMVHAARARRALFAPTPEVAEAEAALAKATQDAPTAPGVATAQALLALAKNDIGAALERAGRARGQDPRDVLAASVELGAKRARGDGGLESAGRELAALELRAQDGAAFLVLRAASALRFGQAAPEGRGRPLVDLARRCATRAIGLAPRRAAAWAIAGGATLPATEARKLLDRALALDPDDPLVALWDGRVRLLEKDGAGAAAALARAVALSPDDVARDAQTWKELARARLLSGDADGAEAAGKKLDELDPYNVDRIQIEVAAARARGNEAQVKEREAAMQRFFRDNRERASRLRQQAYDLGFARGVQLIEESSRLVPYEPRIWRDLTFSRWQTGDPIGAWCAWARGLALEPYDEKHDLEEQTYTNTFKLKEIMNVDSFMQAVSERAEKAPRLAELHFLLGFGEYGRVEFWGEKDKEAFDRGIAHLDRALAIDPRFAVAYALRGHLRRLRGEVGTARDDLERAQMALVGRMPAAHYYLAGLEASLGDTDAALRALERAVREGFQDKKRLLKDPGLSTIADEPRVRPIIDRLPQAPQTGFNEGF